MEALSESRQTFIQGRIQGEGARGAHPPPRDDLRPFSN